MMPSKGRSSDYRKADNEFFALFRERGEALLATTKTTAFPDTYRAMFGFYVKTSAMKTALFDMIDANNPYAFKALFRCYCEHYLKFTYLFVRFGREKSDAVGREYFSHCGAAEAGDYYAALKMAEGLLGNTVSAQAAPTTEEEMRALHPYAAGLSEGEIKEVADRFRYRAILRFLSREEPPMLSKENPFLARIVPAYARLSSFVHGGPWTDLDMSRYHQPEALEECAADARLAVLMTASVLMFTAAAVSREFPEHRIFAAKIKAIMKRYSGESDAG